MQINNKWCTSIYTNSISKWLYINIRCLFKYSPLLGAMLTISDWNEHHRSKQWQYNIDIFIIFFGMHIFLHFKNIKCENSYYSKYEYANALQAHNKHVPARKKPEWWKTFFSHFQDDNANYFIFWLLAKTEYGAFQVAIGKNWKGARCVWFCDCKCK